MTKMMKLMPLAASLVLLTASCSKENVLSTELTNPANGIQFSSYNANGLGTKGSSIDGNSEFNVANNKFQVIGYNTTSAVGTSKWMEATIKYTTTWAYEDANETGYWPTNASQGLDFYAFFPADSSQIVDATTSAGLSLTYTVPTEVKKQIDLMYAVRKDVKKADTDGLTDGKVNLPFEHALSQIAVKGATKSKFLFVDVKAVSFVNIDGSATLTASTESTDINDGTTGDAVVANAGVWTNNADSYTKTFAGAIDTAATAINTVKVGGPTEAADYDAITDEANVLMLIPQALKKDTITFTGGSSLGTAGAKFNGAYMQLAVRVYKEGVAQEDLYEGNLYLPLANQKAKDDTAATWEQGYKYNYLITFDEMGGTLDIIEFNPSAEEWVTKDSFEFVF